MGHKIHLLRHAPLLNVKGIAYGREAEIDRSPRQTFCELAQNLPVGALWITSAYPRTLATAEELVKEGAQPAAWPPRVHTEFNEQNWGNWVDRPRSEIAQTDPVYPVVSRYLSGWQDAKAPGGESFSELQKRIADALNKVVSNCPSGEVVIVSHGRSLRAAMIHAGFGDTENAVRYKVRHLSHLILTHEPGRAKPWQIEKLP